VKVKDGEAVGVWVKKDVHPLTIQPIHFTQDEQEDGRKANYLGELQQACSIISKYVTYFKTGDLSAKGHDQANIISIANDLDLQHLGATVCSLRSRICRNSSSGRSSPRTSSQRGPSP